MAPAVIYGSQPDEAPLLLNKAGLKADAIGFVSSTMQAPRWSDIIAGRRMLEPGE